MMTNERNDVAPRFSIKNAFYIFLAGLIGGVLFPYFFYLMNWDSRIAVMIFLPLLLATAIAYGQCFIESKQGISSKFYKILIIAWGVLGIASYLWLYKGIIF